MTLTTGATGRTKSRRNHPAYAGRPRGFWYEDLVGVIRGYPPTLEAFQRKQEQCRAQVIRLNAEGKANRAGVPDGWAGQAKLISEIHTRAKREARKVVVRMKQSKRFEADNFESELVLQNALEIIEATKITDDMGKTPLYAAKDRIAAMKLVMDNVQRKPMNRQDIAVTAKAEDWLSKLTKGRK